MQVGDKIICVDSSKQPHTIEELSLDCPNWVVRDGVYTVREICDYDFVQALLLEEISNPPKFFKAVNRVVEPAFLISRFRKMEEVKQTEKIKEESLV